MGVQPGDTLYEVEQKSEPQALHTRSSRSAVSVGGGE